MSNNETKTANVQNEKTVTIITTNEIKPFVEHRGRLTYYPNSNTVYFYQNTRRLSVPNDVLYRGKIFSSYVLKSGKISLNARIDKTDNLGDAYLAMRTELDEFFEKLRKSSE